MGSSMTARFISLALILAPLAACSSKSGEPPVSPAPAPTEPAVEESPAATEEPEQVQNEPTEEELERQKAAEQLARDRAQMQADAQQELSRWTPELREQAQRLAATKYPTLEAGLKAALASPHRQPGHAERDSARHPLETLKFFGLKPSMTVLEYGPGGGWYTELLAPVLAAQGKLIVTTADPKGPPESRATLYAERLQLFLEKSPELFGKVQPVIFGDFSSPELGLENEVDMALVIRGMHSWVREGNLNAWLQQIHKALKPGGVLGIVQHRAAPGADPQQTAPKGYVPEAWLIEQVQAQGFKLQAKSEINANPKDTRDYEVGVWALPPNLRLGDQDREKYIAIGESDRMTLRFVKAAK